MKMSIDNMINMTPEDFDLALSLAKQAGREEAIKAVSEAIRVQHPGIAHIQITAFREIESRFGMKWHRI